MATKKPTTSAGTKAPARNTGAAADVLSQLSALAPAKAPPKKSGKDRWELPLDADAQAHFRRWSEAKAVSEPVIERLENSKAELNEYCLNYMAGLIFKNKSKPSNPDLRLLKNGQPDHQAIFMMTDKFKYRFPDVPEGVQPRDHFIKVFTDLGLHPNDAERLVDTELDFTPIVGLRSLTELLEGHYGEGREWVDSTEDEKEAGRKLAALLMWDGSTDVEPLSAEEKALVVRRNPGIQVKAGFYDRVATYVQTEQQLQAIFTVIQPIVYPGHPKFAMSDTPKEQLDRKIQAAADILGTAATN